MPAIQNATALSLQEIREKITNQCVTALTAYRKLCTQPNTGAGQVGELGMRRAH